MAGMIGGFHNTLLIPRLFFQPDGGPQGAPADAGPVAPEVKIKATRIKRDQTFSCTPPGVVCTWGTEVSLEKVAFGDGDAAARLAVETELARLEGGRLIDNKTGRPVEISDAPVRYKEALTGLAGPGWLDPREEGGEPEWFGGDLPKPMRSPRDYLLGRNPDGSTRFAEEALRGTPIAEAFRFLGRSSKNGASSLLAAGRFGGQNSRFNHRKVFGRQTWSVGSSFCSGMPGVDDLVRVIRASGDERKWKELRIKLKREFGVDATTLPNFLQGGGDGPFVGLEGPKEEPLPERLDPEIGVATWGPALTSSAECASEIFAEWLAIQAMSNPGNRWRPRLMHVGASEMPMGSRDARVAQIGFQVLGATEPGEALRKRIAEEGGDPNDLSGLYAPLTTPTGFWMGAAAVHKAVGSLGDMIRWVRERQIRIAGILGGIAVCGDQGQKDNVAELGQGGVNALFWAMDDARAKGFPIEKVRYVGCHGTNTHKMNELEPGYIDLVFRSLGLNDRVKLGALKGLVLHNLSAAAGVEEAVLLAGLRRGRLPGLYNLSDRRRVILAPGLKERFDVSGQMMEGAEAFAQITAGFWGKNAARVRFAVTGEILERADYAASEIDDILAASREMEAEAAVRDVQLLTRDPAFDYITALANMAFA